MPLIEQQLLSRHDELKERARQLLEATKREARENERSRRQKEDMEKENNGDLSPKKVSGIVSKCFYFNFMQIKLILIRGFRIELVLTN